MAKETRNALDLSPQQVDTFSAIFSGIEGFWRELSDLRKANKALTRKVEDLEVQPSNSNDAPGDTTGEDMENTSPRRARCAGGPKTKTKAMLEKEVKALSAQLEKLEKLHKKDRSKIKRLQQKELQLEAAELKDANEEHLQDEDGDSVHTMRKLLRRFQDLMGENSLEEDEECPICMEKLEKNKCLSFPCQHHICADCLPSLRPLPYTPQEDVDNEVKPCPTCRETAARDELVTTVYSATEIWDELLKVATAWGVIDTRGEDDTSVEESAEEFVNDEDEEEEDGEDKRETAPGSALAPEAALSPLSSFDDDSEPRTPSPRPSRKRYGDPTTPASEKRKRLQELAERRKRRRL